MFRQALAEEQQKKAQAEQEFAMQQKLQQEQLKAAQQQQKLMDSEEKRQQQQFDWQKQVNETPISDFITMSGLTPEEAPFLYSDAMKGKRVKDVPGITDFVMNYMSRKLDPNFRFNSEQTVWGAINAGWEKEAILGLAKNVPWMDKDKLDTAITARDLSPDNLLKTLGVASKMREGMLLDLTTWANEYEQAKKKAGSEQDATKKKQYEAEAQAALDKLNWIPDNLTSRYKDTTGGSVVIDMVRDMYDSELIRKYPELVSELMQVHTTGGGSAGRYRSRGGDAPPDANEIPYYVAAPKNISVEEEYYQDKAAAEALAKRYHVRSSFPSMAAWKEEKYPTGTPKGSDIGTPPPPNPFEPPS